MPYHHCPHRLAIRTLKIECTHRWSKPVPKQLSCHDFSCSNCKPPIMKSNCVKALSATRLQVQLSALGMFVSSLLSMDKPCCNTHLASNCPRALRLPSPQVPKTAESSPFSDARALPPPHHPNARSSACTQQLHKTLNSEKQLWK